MAQRKQGIGRRSPGENRSALEDLRLIERKVLWLATWMIHNANHVRPSRDGLKVGGHQASCASAATLLTALYMRILRPEDRIAVKPHASPVMHAIHYLLEMEGRETLERFRGLGGAQSYPSRTKDACPVDFSTGSVGLGVGATLFASMVQDYLRMHGFVEADRPAGRMIAVAGDAELDEGNIFEALLEGWKHDVRNLWWVIDYNRQSLDGVINMFLFQKIEDFFRSVGWNVVTLKYGKRLHEAFEGPAGGALRQWIDDCPNPLYSALTFAGGAAWRDHLQRDLRGSAGLKELLDTHDDESLHGLMTNLAGHDMQSVVEAFESVSDDTPQCFIAYTIKGLGLPFAGHKDNHAGLMNDQQMETFRRSHGIPHGSEWEPFAGMEDVRERLESFLSDVSYRRDPARSDERAPVAIPEVRPPEARRSSTQEAFGRILNEIGRGDSPAASRIVTTSPDVTVSTNLGGWVNQRGLFDRETRSDLFRLERIASAQKWDMSPGGQHIELGIAENNLFLLLATLGLSHDLFGTRLLPIGTIYDIFIGRGLDALNYACYQDARFLLVGTPAGITLAPEGGAHQSVATPLIGLSQDKLITFEPAFADELAVIVPWALAHMQRPDGSAVYVRLSTRQIDQPAREMSAALRDKIIAGGYWYKKPAPGSDTAIVYAGPVAPEVLSAHAEMLDDMPGAGLLAVTSPERLHAGWRQAMLDRRAGRRDAVSHVERLLGALPVGGSIVTVIDGHPATLSWLGAVHGHAIAPLGVDRFGQSGDIPDLYRTYGIDTDALIDAVAEVRLRRFAGQTPASVR
jgi:pyruvate dehydrogenase E1 component